ncbi:winged helix DNA-binding domain-containing protein [Streptomyces indicus]|uniref:Winged helix DNA-binding domain-containing protein n=1 Tax=Streptomyces indicus TaxID=417292 RepID=A0A1G9BHT4_9ACTN|nr:winged helix DNA-binding domain-containing protein [Streptomyces indicus]SDK38780.1 Winged helix DNA-binding domain-containing protein [Streptomyces indicus]
MPLTVSWTTAQARRFARQSLDVPAQGDPPAQLARLAAAMCGTHAQVASAAELSLALRHDRATRQEVREALFTASTLVKTYGPRGTVHLLPAAELPLWLGALSAQPTGAQHPDGVRLDARQTDEVVAAIAEALDGRFLTVDELTDEIVARTGPWAGELTMEAFQTKWPRWRTVMHTAGHRGALCFGPNRGRKVTYTRPQAGPPLPADEALPALVRSYLHAYGPATPESFAKWLAMPVGWARTAFHSCKVTEVDFEGTPAWVAADDTDFPAFSEPVRGVRLLPYFDSFGIDAYPRDRFFPGRARDRALARGQAGNYPLLVVDGEVAGVWHQKRAGKRIAVTVEPLVKLSAGQVRELEGQVARVGEVLEGTAELTVGEVAVGPHA